MDASDSRLHLHLHTCNDLVSSNRHLSSSLLNSVFSAREPYHVRALLCPASCPLVGIQLANYVRWRLTGTRLLIWPPRLSHVRSLRCAVGEPRDQSRVDADALIAHAPNSFLKIGACEYHSTADQKSLRITWPYPHGESNLCSDGRRRTCVDLWCAVIVVMELSCRS